MRKINSTDLADASTWPPLAAPREVHDLVALPPPILKLIFAYASDRIDESTYIADHFYPQRPVSIRQSTSRLLMVYKSWNRAIAVIEKEFNAVAHTIRLQTALPDEVPRIYQALEAKRGRIRDLRVWLGASDWLGCNVFSTLLTSIESAEQLEIDWQRVFSSCPNLVRLYLSLVPLTSRHFITILDTASTVCRNLQPLTFLKGLNAFPIKGEPDFRGIMRHLFQALECWYQYQGPDGGLRQFAVPRREEFLEENEFAHPDEYLENVTAFCPNIEYLHDWRSEDLYVDPCLCILDNWHKFFKTCARLYDFCWSFAPLGDEVLKVFAAYPRPELKKMVFACGNSITDQEDYISQVFHHQRAFQVTSDGLVRAIAACPALEELHSMLAVDIIYDSIMLQDAINDVVLVDVSQSCPCLKKLFLYELSEDGSALPLYGVTEVGPIAILRLPKLEHVAMKATNVSAKGILALIHNAPDPQLKRRVVMEVGCLEGFRHVCFFEELVKSMKLLVQLPANSFEGHRFELELQAEARVEPEPPKPLVKKVISLSKRVMARHSSVGVHFTKICRPPLELPTDLEDFERVFFVSPRGPTGSTGPAFDMSWRETSVYHNGTLAQVASLDHL